jgi:hypothetical protein
VGVSEQLSFEEAHKKASDLMDEVLAYAKRDGSPPRELLMRLAEATRARDNHPDIPMLREFSRISHEELEDLT